MFNNDICKNMKILKKIKTWSVGYTTSVRIGRDGHLDQSEAYDIS